MQIDFVTRTANKKCIFMWQSQIRHYPSY